MNDSSVTYRAKWILPVDQPPIENGSITCQSGTIVQIGKYSNQESIPSIDLGEVALIPGLVNAHTHLEFSDLEIPLGDPAAGFTSWIESVIAHRSESDSSANSNKLDAIQNGIEQSVRAGVVAVGEIATSPWDAHAYNPTVSGVVFHEQLGNNPLETANKVQQINDRVQSFPTQSWSPGISPHAPYSTSLNLFQSLVSLSIQNKVPVAMHLAETLEEIEFIETGKGPFAEMLTRLGVPFSRSGPITTSDYIQCLAQTNSLIVHGNFLNSEELQLIAESDNLQIVFCPRTHAYFGHPEYPLRSMLDLGIDVAVGTDSRASNPDLDLYQELKHIATSQSSVSPTEILRMGTLSGANALGLQRKLGVLASGKSAQFCVVSRMDNSQSPLDTLFAPNTVCQSVVDYVNQL